MNMQLFFGGQEIALLLLQSFILISLEAKLSAKIHA